MTVPPRDLLFQAKRNVGTATSDFVWNKSMDRVGPEVQMSWKMRALNMAAGIRSSHSESQPAIGRRVRKNSGNQRGI